MGEGRSGHMKELWSKAQEIKFFTEARKFANVGKLNVREAL